MWCRVLCHSQGHKVSSKLSETGTDFFSSCAALLFRKAQEVERAQDGDVHHTTTAAGVHIYQIGLTRQHSNCATARVHSRLTRRNVRTVFDDNLNSPNLFEKGKDILDKSGLKIISATDLNSAAEKIVNEIFP